MALKVYGAARTRTVRTLWMMGELGMPYEHVPVSTQDGANLKPDFVALNPTGRVPAIDDGGFVLSESMAINLYLAKTYGGTDGHRFVNGVLDKLAADARAAEIAALAR